MLRFDRPVVSLSNSPGSARTIFEALTQLVRSPFALSSLRSGRVEGLYANQLALEIEQGDNDLYIALDYPNLGRYLRLDPISRLGEISIKSLEIKKVKNSF